MVMAFIAICMRMALGRRAFVMPRDHALRSDDRCQPLDGQRRREERNRNYPEEFRHHRLLYVSCFEYRTHGQFPRMAHLMLASVMSVHDRVALAA